MGVLGKMREALLGPGPGEGGAGPLVSPLPSHMPISQMRETEAQRSQRDLARVLKEDASGHDGGLGPSDPRSELGSNVQAGEGPGLAGVWKLLLAEGSPSARPPESDKAGQRLLKLLFSADLTFHVALSRPCQALSWRQGASNP